MNEATLARILIEDVPAMVHNVDRKVGVLASRMLLQIQATPALMSQLSDFAVVTADGSKDKNAKVKLQFDFLLLPREVIPDLERLLALSFFSDYRIVNFTKNGQARTGVEVTVSPDDLPGDDKDYAF